MNKRPRSIAFYVYAGSVALHAAFALGALALPKQKRDVQVAIQLAEAKKKKAPPKPVEAPPPPPPKQEKPKEKPPQPEAKAKAAADTKPAAAAPPPVAVGADGFADLGMSMGNADGPGMAVPAAAAAGSAKAAATAAPSPTTAHKVSQLAPAAAETCTEPVVRPKRKVPVAPKYTMQARQAEIEGVVRVEVTVDESGHVLSARVLNALGYGLDESAVTAAKATTFEPATRCGKPVVGTTVLPFRFEQT